MNNKIFATIIALSMLSGCASKPETIVLQPNVTNMQGKVYQDHSAKLVVSDLRSTNHVVEVLGIEKPSTMIDASSSLQSVLNTEFSEELASQGLKVSNDSKVKLQFLVERARTYVNQDVLDYRANTIIKLKVKVDTVTQTMSKTFTQRATSRGAFDADMEDLQIDFNRQLSKLISKVLTDQQLQEFIKG